jgi:glycosyltransferase involved in cell wall biosynthesis
MRKAGRMQVDKLLWRLASDGAERFDTTYDLAVAYLEGGSAYYVADHVRAKKKAAWIHIDYPGSGYTSELDHDCYRKFDRIFCVAEETREKFLEVYPDLSNRTAIFENLLDKESIQSKSTLPGGFKDGYAGMRLLTIGRLDPQKGYDVAIQSMSILKDRGVKVRWYVLGEGGERGMLEGMIAERDLADDFMLLGATDNPYTFLRQCDVYVHATRFEGKSIAIREAQALGKPLIASDCPGNREAIEDKKDGILCAFDPESIADAIECMLKDTDLRERYAAASLAHSNAEKSDIYKFYELLDMEEVWDADYDPVVPHGRTYAGQNFGVAADQLDEFELERAFEVELRRQKASSSGKSHYEGR